MKESLPESNWVDKFSPKYTNKINTQILGKRRRFDAIHVMVSKDVIDTKQNRREVIQELTTKVITTMLWKVFKILNSPNPS